MNSQWRREKSMADGCKTLESSFVCGPLEPFAYNLSFHNKTASLPTESYLGDLYSTKVKFKFALFKILLICPVVFVSSELAPQSFRDEVVQRHNELRAKHQVGPVTENPKISLFAQEWADHIASSGKLAHRQFFDYKSYPIYGENLASHGNTSASGKDFVDLLYTEEKQIYRDSGFYDSPNDVLWAEVGHFTAIVWKKTTEIGTGKAGGIVVINYNPQGNNPCCTAENVLRPKE